MKLILLAIGKSLCRAIIPMLLTMPLQRLFPMLPCTDPDSILHILNENFPVAVTTPDFFRIS